MWPSNGLSSCKNGTIEYMRFVDPGEEARNPAIIIKLSSYSHEHYTDHVNYLAQPLLHAFAVGSEIELRTTACDQGDFGFGSFVLYPPKKNPSNAIQPNGVK